MRYKKLAIFSVLLLLLSVFITVPLSYAKVPIISGANLTYTKKEPSYTYTLINGKYYAIVELNNINKNNINYDYNSDKLYISFLSDGDYITRYYDYLSIDYSYFDSSFTLNTVNIYNLDINTLYNANDNDILLSIPFNNYQLTYNDANKFILKFRFIDGETPITYEGTTITMYNKFTYFLNSRVTDFYNIDMNGYDIGYSDGYDYGFNTGYNAGVIDGSVGDGGDVGQVFTIITNGIFGGIATALGVELFMGLTIGALVLIPLLFGLIAFIVGGKKK